MVGGTKHDDGKAPLDLIPSAPLLEVAQVLAFGASKYGRHNWRAGISYSRLISAALRHVYAYNAREDNDSETGRSHLAHAICCLLFLLEQETTRPDLDDRYKGGK